MGVSYKSGVSPNETQRTFAEGLAAVLPFAITVTSGTRSIGSQASAMLSKIQREGTDVVYKLYSQKDLVGEVLAAPRSVSAITAVLAKQVAKGRYISGHMRSDALDLRTNDKTSSQIEQMTAAVEKLGAKPVVESDHLHVGHIGASVVEQAKALVTSAGQVASAAGSGAMTLAVDNRKVILWAVGGGAALGALWLLLRGRRKRRRTSTAAPSWPPEPPMAANSRRRHSHRRARRARSRYHSSSR